MTQMPSLTADIQRVIVLGHTGFIGGPVMRRLKANHPDVDVLGFSLADLDLTNPNAVDAIVPYLSAETAIVMSAAIKRQLGDSPDIYMQNAALATNIANLIARNPVRRVVYLSSTAVYGEDIEGQNITESTPVNCRTYYGLSKYTAEWMVAKVASSKEELSAGSVRLPTVYGPGDAGTTYGPSGFLNAALADRPIALQGDGSELREFLYIDDVVEMIERYVFIDHSGPINLVSGNAATFNDIIAAIAQATGKIPEVIQNKRRLEKVDATFDPTFLRAMMPELAFTSLADGVQHMLAARS